MIISFKNDKPFVEGVCLDELTTAIETPFYLYSQKSITDAFKKLKDSLNAKIFFSVKANSNQAIISLMRSLGAGADVVSAGELERALRAGISPDKIIFEGVGKSLNDIEYAVHNNIRQINIESMEELNMINAIGQTLNKKIIIGIRLNPDIDSQTHCKISTGRRTDKFGIAFDLLPDLCSEIKKLEQIKLNGISCHIGSQIHNIKVFERVFDKMKKATEIIKENDLSINHLDLGGGFGVVYDDEKELNLKELSFLISSIFKNTAYDISFEPGRYLVANAGVVITKILTTKRNESVNYLITDAGMQTLLRPAIYNAFHNIIALTNISNDKIEYTVAGPICESSDILAKKILLSQQQTGNYLAICDTGAYGAVMSSNYNTKGLPAEILVSNDSFSIIRNHEKISDIISRDIIPYWLKD